MTLKKRLNEKKRQAELFAKLNLSDLSNVKLLFIRYFHPISDAQIEPIIESYHYGRAAILSLSISDLDNPSIWLKLKKITQCSIIGIQTHWDVTKEFASIIERLRETVCGAKVVFFDWYAPLHIPAPWLLEHCDLYVKKQLPADTGAFVKGIRDTNLREYETQWNALFRSSSVLLADSSLIETKLHAGWNFATDRNLIKLLKSAPNIDQKRDIDLHCRICAPINRDAWYPHMRGRAFDAIQNLRDTVPTEQQIVCDTTRLSFERYMNELGQSKVCFSPFGFGEVCWRDFEAILAGALLLKPDMSHLNTQPNIYVAYETYIPVKWDFSDLQAQYQWVIDHPEERRRISLAARQVWRDFLIDDWPLIWASIGERLNIPVGDCQNLWS